MIDQYKIYEIVNRIVEGYKPQQIILFGSFANGTPNEDSDIDLFVLKNTDKPPLERTIDVSMLLKGTKVPVDLLVYTYKEFNENKNKPYTIEYQIAKEGKTIYMELNKKQIIKEWIDKADEDFGTAKIIYLQMPDYKDTICFHCQQAVEKYLKAYLIQKDIEFQRTHDLKMLLDLISDVVEIESEWYIKAAKLQFYAVNIRYPSGRYNPNEVRDKEAIDIADDFRQWLIPKIENKE